MDRQFDIIVYGATGFTGRLVVEYLAGRNHGQPWAIAGRDGGRLSSLAAEVGLPDLPIIVADADDRPALDRLARQTRLVLATAGPFFLYGSTLVEMCASAGTDYVNISGEPLWAREMIDAHTAAAERSGARFLLSSGYDSIPTELGVLELQALAIERLGAPLSHVAGRCRSFNGTLSGGTIASGRAAAEMAKDPDVRARMIDPFLLTPGFAGVRQPASHRVVHDAVLDVWLAPFMMAPINSKNLHRSNMLLGHLYGKGFTYDEMMIVGAGEDGRIEAERSAKLDYTQTANAPKPGEGPSREDRENGDWEMLYYGLGPLGEPLAISVKGDHDPGYGSTSKMVSETALLLLDSPPSKGGFYTPGAVLGHELTRQLVTFAGVEFRNETL